MHDVFSCSQIDNNEFVIMLHKSAVRLSGARCKEFASVDFINPVSDDKFHTRTERICG